MVVAKEQLFTMNENKIIVSTQNYRLNYKKLILLTTLSFFFILFGLLFFISTQKEPEEVVTDPYRENIRGLYEKDKQAGEVAGGQQKNYGVAEGAGENTPEGTIIISAVKKQQSEPIGTYTLDLKNEGFEKIVGWLGLNAMTLPLVQDNPTDFFTLAVSSSTNAEPDGAGIHLINSDTKKLTYYTSARGRNERNFAWSQSASFLAFNRLKNSDDKYGDLLSIDNWEVAVIDPKKDSLLEVISAASKPLWSPDGTQLIYLKNDGLYAKHLGKNNEKSLISIPESGLVTTMSMIGVSPDGKYLIWTTPKAGVIRIIEVLNWSTITVKEVGRIQTSDAEYYWPIFSPDSSFYAVQAIDTVRKGEIHRRNSRIEIRDIMHKDPISTISLKQFDFNQLFTNAWVNRL